MGVPLVIGDNTLGILTVSHRVPHSYSAVHLRLLQSFANVVAIAINNARRYEEAQAIATYEERNRLARELHDSVTQSLFSANLVAEVLPTLAQNNPGVFDKSLEALARFTQSALAEMRTMLMELRPSSLTQAPLDSVIKNLLLTIAGRSQLEIVHPRIDPVPLLQEDAQVALYRIVQESLTNIVKHSQARHAEFELRVSPPFDPRGHDHWEGEITIAIADDGKGFDERAVPQGHMGLQIMRERSASIGASLEISSKPGDGTQVSISWAGAAAVSKRPTADDRR
jgi:signal transduction histidine kinase